MLLYICGDIMRNFVISDIHGNGNLYYSVMSYLENVSKMDEVTLFINGDLIDRGLDSGEILLDVIERIKNPDNPFNIVYLGGNHEVLMYQFYSDVAKGKYSYFNDWYDFGGYLTDDYLIETLDDKEEIFKVSEFVSNLKIYHKFAEKIDGKNIVLCHAACPLTVKDDCHLKVNSQSISIEYLLNARRDDPFIPFRCRIGHISFFTIVGHTPNRSKLGYEYHEDENYLNIDGGCACYAYGKFKYDHYPLVEINDGYLRILTFNNNNEITDGNYFINYESVPFSEEELELERSFLSKSFKPKKLIKNCDGLVTYEED